MIRRIEGDRYRIHEVRPQRELCDGEYDQCDERAKYAVEYTFANERHANIGVCRTDELHDRDFPSPRKNRQANRIRNNDSCDENEQRDNANPDTAQHFTELQQTLHECLARTPRYRCRAAC